MQVAEEPVGKVVWEKVIPVRLLTPTRPAIELVVRQTVNADGVITSPTVTVRGERPIYIESWKFCVDYGAAWIVAGYFMRERQALVGSRT